MVEDEGEREANGGQRRRVEERRGWVDVQVSRRVGWRGRLDEAALVTQWLDGAGEVDEASQSPFAPFVKQTSQTKQNKQTQRTAQISASAR